MHPISPIRATPIRLEGEVWLVLNGPPWHVGFETPTQALAVAELLRDRAHASELSRQLEETANAAIASEMEAEAAGDGWPDDVILLGGLPAEADDPPSVKVRFAE